MIKNDLDRCKKEQKMTHLDAYKDVFKFGKCHYCLLLYGRKICMCYEDWIAITHDCEINCTQHMIPCE
jgi:hypothetical protein